MALHDVDGNAFGLLVPWLYTKTISEVDLTIESQSEAKDPTPSSTVSANLQESAEPKICKRISSQCKFTLLEAVALSQRRF